MAKKSVPRVVKKIRCESKTIDEAVDLILKENGITKPPINVIKIAGEMGFKVFTVEFTENNVIGAIADFKDPIGQFNNERRVIAVDRKSNATKKIFTIAHEIGHFVMHCGEHNDFFERDVYNGPDNEMRPSIEEQADKFAACLLLPKEMFIDFVANSPYYKAMDKETLIQDICKTYIVSKKTAELRLQEVGMDF